MSIKKIAGIFIGVVCLGLAVWYFIDKGTFKEHKIKVTTTDSLEISKNIIEKPYTPLPVADSFRIETKKIKWGQNLAYILHKKTNLNNTDVNRLINNTSEVFDLRKIKAGAKYKLYFDRNDSAKYLVYNHSKIDFLIYNLDSVNVKLYSKPIRTERQKRSGKIESSLWNAMVHNNINPVVAGELSDIYAWTIDFFGLQKGDKFTVIYDEEFADSTSIGVSKVYGAVFEHNGEKHFAINFEQDSTESFWDEKGNSLRKAFLKSPLKFSRVSSKFSRRRFHPILKIYRPHSGVDYAAPTGTPVYSIGDGKVITKRYSKSAGYYVKIKHNSVYITQYNHFSKFAKGIKVGQRVKQGQIIGYVGATGYATGPHLDFRIFKSGKAIDPLKVKAPPVKPIKETYQEAFNTKKDKIINELDETVSASLS